MNEIRLTPLEGIPEIKPGDDVPELLVRRVPAGPGILVVAQKIISKAEGRLVELAKVEPTTVNSRAAWKRIRDTSKSSSNKPAASSDAVRAF